jgi:hypothetical protein
MMRCPQCAHFVKTYEGEGWCSQPRYSGLIILTIKSEPCYGNGYVRGNESPQYQPPATEENPRTP